MYSKTVLCIVARKTDPVNFCCLQIGGCKLIDYQIDRLKTYFPEYRFLLLTDIENLDLKSDVLVVYKNLLPTDFHLIGDLICSETPSLIGYNICLVRAEALYVTSESINTICSSTNIAISGIFFNKTIITSDSLHNEKILEPVDNIVFIPSKVSSKELHIVPLSLKESFCIDNEILFELSLALEAKENRKKELLQVIRNRIQEKKGGWLNASAEAICLIGHSQFDQWNIQILADHQVINAGISGISSTQYINEILRKEYLNLSQSKYFLLLGTNDVIYDLTDDEICNKCQEIIDIIKFHNASAEIYFFECLPVNGRMDRNNKRIESLNEIFRNKLNSIASIIPNERFKDAEGNLCQEFTFDGLHLTTKGYEVMQTLIEQYLSPYSRTN